MGAEEEEHRGEQGKLNTTDTKDKINKVHQQLIGLYRHPA
jgi:hypothetical protein